MNPRVGVLALQGDFAAHAGSLQRAGAVVVEVRTAAELDGCAGLVIPGGESTTLLKLMEGSDLPAAIASFQRGGGVLFGTCAGTILLARETRPAQRCLALIDLVAERNAYGRQRESFEAEAQPLPPLAGDPLPMLFIRAPRIVEMGAQVTPLATLNGDVVLALQGQVLVATGHPELTRDLRVHRLFLDRVRESVGIDAMDRSGLKNQPFVGAEDGKPVPAGRSAP
jgi:5'-phosphate synthase pdxT subunit